MMQRLNFYQVQTHFDASEAGDNYNTVTKEESAYHVQFILLSQCFQQFSIMIFSFLEVFYNFPYMVSK